MQEKENIFDILTRTKEAIKVNNTFEMKRLSDRTVHTASIYHDTDNIAVAVIIYALSKILEREKYSTYKSWPNFFKTCLKEIDNAMLAIKNDNMDEFRNAITKIRKAIDKISGHLKYYIEEVFRKASINKASRIYEHGISMQQTAELLGITVFELAEYAGKTGIADVDLSITKDIKERLKIAEEIFK